MAPPAIPPGRQLPSKEANLFKQVMRLYENKQYKKGIKTADQILNKFPEHGETLAMKGLMISFFDRKDEAYEIVKKALRLDLTSHICWHVLGLLYRADKNYEEAIKCYKNALRNDKDNVQLMRDLSVLHIQTRNFEGLKEVRNQLLNSKPQQKLSWIGLALAYHLNENYDMALKILNAFDSSQGQKDPNTYDFEQSEMLLYRNRILIESKKYEEALTDLEKIKLFVFDELYVQETKAEIYQYLGKFEEAKEIYKNLINENPENSNYYSHLATCMKIENDSGKLLALYDEFIQKFPKANVPKRLSLNVSEGQDFEKRVEQYIVSWVRKGAPSLFVSIKPLIKDSQKKKSIEIVANKLYQAVSTTGKLNENADKEEPTFTLWILFFLSKFYDYIRESTKALEFIDKAIQHTPTILDLLHQKAKIYKHSGDLNKAKEFINQARELDLQDRWINTKCTKYMIRANSLQEAENTISLFTKADSVDTNSTLVEMQCMWYTIEGGKVHLKNGEYGKALKRFHQIEKHFVDISEDQLDFHSYCIRRVTLRAYIEFLKYEDRVRGHKFFFQAAKSAIECYLTLIEKPKETRSSNEEDLSTLSEDERKKALNKLKKAEAKAKEKTDSTTQKPKAQNQNQKPVDEDPNGEKYLNVDYIEEGLKFLKPLLQFHSGKIDTHLLAIKLYLHKKKYLLALKSILKAHTIDSKNPELHLLTVQLMSQVQNDNTIRDVSRQLINEELSKFTQSQDLKTFNAKFLESFSKSAPHVIAAAKSLLFISSDLKQEFTKIISSIDSTYENLTLEVAVSICNYVNGLKETSLYESLFSKFSKIFVYSTFFHPELLEVKSAAPVAAEN